MISRNKNLAESGLHFVLAATYLAHQPTPQSIVAVLAYLGLAALSLADREEKRNEREQPDTIHADHINADGTIRERPIGNDHEGPIA